MAGLWLQYNRFLVPEHGRGSDGYPLAVVEQIEVMMEFQAWQIESRHRKKLYEDKSEQNRKEGLIRRAMK